MLTFRFLHRATSKAIAIFLALNAAAQAAEIVNLGVPNYNNCVWRHGGHREHAR